MALSASRGVCCTKSGYGECNPTLSLGDIIMYCVALCTAALCTLVAHYYVLQHCVPWLCSVALCTLVVQHYVL